MIQLLHILLLLYKPFKNVMQTKLITIRIIQTTELQTHKLEQAAAVQAHTLAVQLS